MKTAILTDSGCNLPKAYIEKNKNLFVIPLIINIDDESFRDQLEITSEEIYRDLNEKNIKTSLPKTGDLHDIFEKVKKEGYEGLLVINISSGLSGTFNAFRIEIEQERDFAITHYDTKTLGAQQGYIVREAVDLVNKGVDVKEIIEKLDELRYKNSKAYYTIATLKYLRKGGRIGKVEGTIGDLLHIKPVITVNDEGVYVTASKALGLKRSLLNMKNILIEDFGSDLIDLTVHYASDKEKAEELGETLKRALSIRNLELSELTPVLGIHTGPDMFAYVARRVKT